MDQNTNNGAQMPAEEKNSMSSIVSILVIVLVLAFGAFYFLKQVPTPADNGTPSQAEVQSDATVSKLSAQSTSTDLDSIQNDLNSTDLSGVNSSLDNVSI